MSRIHIITPVKNSLQTTLKTIDCVLDSNNPNDFSYHVYDDFSDEACATALMNHPQKSKFNLIQLGDITDTPSPNYGLVLQLAQQQALNDNAHLLLIESDVLIKPDTATRLAGIADNMPDAGMVASVTTDETGEVNYPYLYAKDLSKGVHITNKRLSFCCTLLSNRFLQTVDFATLDPSKDWYDVTISRMSLSKGFKNYLLTNLPVVHLPHSSRPWKQTKYSNPLLYYWRKFTSKRDRI